MEDEQVANTIVLLIILMLCIFGIRGTARRMASGCCAGTDSVKRIRVKDRNKKHYPYQASVTIELTGPLPNSRYCRPFFTVLKALSWP